MTDAELEYHAVAKTSELDDDEAIAVSVGRQDIGLYKLAGEYYALSDICTHAYATMSDGVKIAVAVGYPKGFDPQDQAPAFKGNDLMSLYSGEKNQKA